MAAGKKKAAGKVRITLKVAKSAVKLTADGKRRLDLSKRGIDTFPKCLLKLADVDELDLSRNLLRKIPESIERFVNLRRLDLHSNRIERLPDAVGKLQNLRHLDVCDNLLGPDVPSEIGALQALRSLNLGLNRIETFPPRAFEGLSELRELGLFDNLLAELPEGIRNLPRLRKLNAQRNPFDARGGGEDRVRDTGDLYLRNERELCQACLRKSRERREGLGADDPMSTLRFSGLSTPNSTAWETQALWRMRNFSATESHQRR